MNWPTLSLTGEVSCGGVSIDQQILARGRDLHSRARTLVLLFFMIRDGVRYTDLGPGHFDRPQPERTQRYLIKRLEGLGLKVTVEPAA